MKKILCAVIVLAFSLGLTGCYRFVAEHPEKSQKEFYADQVSCDKKARDYAMERREIVGYDDEIDHSRRCMRGLGWSYRFRRASTSSE